MAGVALEVLATGGCADQVGAEPTERLDEERRAAAEGNVELTPQLRNVTLNGLSSGRGARVNALEKSVAGRRIAEKNDMLQGVSTLPSN